MADVTKEVSAVAPTWTAIDNEKYRMYDFGNGVTYRIDFPVQLNVKRKPEGDSHRVIDALGVSHYVRAGWVAIKWEGKNGPAYSF